MHPKRALITGITGFVGPHLAEALVFDGDVKVMGTYHNNHLFQTPHLPKKVELFPMDLTDPVSIKKTLSLANPDYIFHLAAQSNVVRSWQEPTLTFNVNVIGTLNLFDSIRDLGMQPTIQLACSSEQYGLVKSEQLPVTEETPFLPQSPYAVSRVSADLIGYQYYKGYGLPIVRTRAFNHTGPRQTEQYVCSQFAKKIIQIENGLVEPVLHVGNLEAIRDFTDVRDVVRAYILSVTKAKAGEAYIIASGTGRKIREILDIFLRLSKIKIDVEVDLSLFRPLDVPALFGDSSKFKQTTGWKPTIPFEKTANDLLDYWRRQLSK